MKTAYIIDAIRTPIGKQGGKLATIRPDDMLALLITELVNRNPTIDVRQIEDVIAGAANQAGEDNRCVARMSALLAGLPVSVAGNTVNRLCGSGLQAVMDAARGLFCDEGMLYVAGGVESMSRAPYVTSRNSTAPGGTPETHDSTIGWRFVNNKLTDNYYPYSMGQTAEHIAVQWKISREEQDVFALSSHHKYFAALHQDKWKEEIIPVEITNFSRPFVMSHDEPPRNTNLEKLAALKPAFAKKGTVTAGNSSGINDGAAAILLASEEAVKLFNLQPMARIVSMAVAGVDPAIMGIAPVNATLKALQRAGLRIDDMGLVELSEAFASQSIACIRDLHMDPSIVNVNGGSIALGHPLGSTGARIAVTLLHEIKKRRSKYGLVTTCVGIGQGVSMIVEGL